MISLLPGLKFTSITLKYIAIFVQRSGYRERKTIPNQIFFLFQVSCALCGRDFVMSQQEGDTVTLLFYYAQNLLLKELQNK
jgi:hypothetical protein